MAHRATDGAARQRIATAAEFVTAQEGGYRRKNDCRNSDSHTETTTEQAAAELVTAGRGRNWDSYSANLPNKKEITDYGQGIETRGGDQKSKLHQCSFDKPEKQTLGGARRLNPWRIRQIFLIR